MLTILCITSYGTVEKDVDPDSIVRNLAKSSAGNIRSPIRLWMPKQDFLKTYAGTGTETKTAAN